MRITTCQNQKEIRCTNTVCPDFVLTWNETEFTELFNIHDMQRYTWSEIYNAYPENTVFIEGKDVQTTGQPTAATFCWIKKSAQPDALPSLLYLYTHYRQYQAHYEASKYNFEKAKTKFMKQFVEFADNVLKDMTLEEYLDELRKNEQPD